MSTPDQQDTTDPNSLLYYAPRRLRDRASALRTTQLDSREIIELQAQDGPPSPLPEVLRVSEPEPMEPLWLQNQRTRKKQVLAPVIRFVGVASLAAVAAFTYVVIFTELPDQNAVNETVGQAPKIVTENGDANIKELAPESTRVTNSNSGDTDTTASAPANQELAPAAILETTGSRESSSSITPEQNAALFRQFLQWQDALAQAQRQETSVQRSVPATRDPSPRRKRKARRHQVDEEE